MSVPHSLLRLALTALLAGGLAACKQTTGSESGPVTSLRSKGELFNTPWESISASETRVSIVGDDVIERRARQEPGRKLYTEALKTSRAALMFERRRNVPESQILPADEELLKRHASRLKEAGITAKTADVRKTELDNGQVHYILAEGKMKCFAFFVYSKRSVFHKMPDIDPNYQAMTGSACAQPGSPEAESVEGYMMDLISRVRFDDGKYTRQQIFAGALEQLRLKPLDEDVDDVGPPNAAPPSIVMAESVSAQGGVAVLQGGVKHGAPIDFVRVNGRWVGLDADDRFRTRIKVPPGTSKASIEVVDRQGRQVTKDVTVTAQDGAPTTPQTGRNYALLVAMDDYKRPISKLNTPRQDTDALAGLLREKYGFTVKVVANVSKSQVILALQDLAEQLTEDDNLMVYYAGHGILDPRTDMGYWLPIDAKHNNPGNWLSNKYVAKLIRNIAAKHVLVVADACYSGSFAREQNLLAQTGGLSPDEAAWLRSRTILSSGELEEVLDEGGGNNSLFAMHLLNTLREAASTVSGLAVSAQVRALVTRDAQQKPQYGAVLSAGHDDGGDFVLIRNPSTGS